jgi:hypothetical protein
LHIAVSGVFTVDQAVETISLATENKQIHQLVEYMETKKSKKNS